MVSTSYSTEGMEYRTKKENKTQKQRIYKGKIGDVAETIKQDVYHLLRLQI